MTATRNRVQLIRPTNKKLNSTDKVYSISGMSIRAGSMPKPLVNQPSLASYFHLLLPQVV